MESFKIEFIKGFNEFKNKISDAIDKELHEKVVKKRNIKQVIILYDDGSYKCYNRNAFIARTRMMVRNLFCSKCSR